METIQLQSNMMRIAILSVVLGLLVLEKNIKGTNTRSIQVEPEVWPFIINKTEGL